MSDTTGGGPPPIPNFSATPKNVTVNGSQEQWMTVKFGVNESDANLPDKVIEIRRVDMGDQFDLAEIAGSQIDNDVWLSLAIVALSVQSIDGTPVLHSNLSKATLRSTLKQIGPTGVRAVRQAVLMWDGVAEAAQPADQKIAVGN